MFSLFLQLDKKYLHLLHKLNHGHLKTLFSHANGTEMWIPLYLFIAYLIFRHGKKNAVQMCIFIGVICYLGQQLSSGTLSKFLYNYSPGSTSLLVEPFIGNLDSYATKIGFISTKATNAFAISTFLNLALGKRKNKFLLLFAWPLLISLSQCATKIHCINDVCYSALIGGALGTIVFFIYKQRRSFFKKIIKNFLGRNV